MAQAKMATYYNPSNCPIEVRIGELPGEPWTRYPCAPGGTVEGPASYAEIFGRSGLLLSTPELLERVARERAEAERAAEAAAQAAAEQAERERVEAEAKAAADLARADVNIPRIEAQSDDPDKFFGHLTEELQAKPAPRKRKGE